MLFVHRFHDGEAFLDQRLPKALYPVRLVTVTDKADALAAAAIEGLVEPSCPQGIQFGWGTWIRTRTNGVRVRWSTVNLFPSRRVRQHAKRAAEAPRALPCSRRPKIVNPALQFNCSLFSYGRGAPEGSILTAAVLRMLEEQHQAEADEQRDDEIEQTKHQQRGQHADRVHVRETGEEDDLEDAKPARRV